MKITPNGTTPTRRTPQEYFTGTVWLDPVIDAPEPARVSAARVTFDPGARTHWHTHPFGQTLYVLSGCGRVQTEGGPIREIRPGDVIWFAPGEKHWHGAAPTTSMCHLAIQERQDGSAATWLEPVDDATYQGVPDK